MSRLLEISRESFRCALATLKDIHSPKTETMFSDINVLQAGSVTGTDGLVAASIGGVIVEMIIDSGASVNAVSSIVFDNLVCSKAQLFNYDYNPVKKLHAYASSGSLEIAVRFSATLSITFYSDRAQENGPVSLVEEFYVIKNASRCLLSKTTALRHNVLVLGEEVRKLKASHLQKFDILRNNGCMFEINTTEQHGFEAFNMEPVKLHLRKEVVPTKIRYTNIPLNMRAEANAQLNELVRLHVIEEVRDYSEIEWISSMLAVVKQNGSLRLVVDLRGPNKAIIRDSYRMPTLELVVSKLAECKFFSTIDLTNAFYHVVLDESSRHVTTFWTGEKYFRFKRLPFGLTNAPDIFQRALQDVVLKDCRDTLNYLDDILVFTKTEAQHDISLSEVMSRLKEHNVQLNLNKCCFKRDSVTFLGFKLSGKGLSITEDRMKAFIDLREPESLSEVKSFLGMLTFLERFIIDRASKTAHLREISNSETFLWSSEAQKEFDAIKNKELNRIASLDFYNPAWSTELLVDASPTGLGAILVQYDHQKSMHVICCASKALTPVEKRYPQQHREALAMVWGIERFKFYLLGIKFIVRTDNRANEFIFGNDAYVQGKRAVNRSQIFALRLQPYNFLVKRVKGDANAADALSRLISREQFDEDFEKENVEDIFAMTEQFSPISLDDIEKASQEDELYNKISNGLEMDIWDSDSRGLRGSRDKVRIWQGILYFDERFYIPESLRVRVLEIAHIGHISASSMKRLLRAHVWWPGMTVDIDSYHSECRGCTLTSNCVITPPLAPRPLPQRPLDIVHIDFLKLTGIAELLVAIDGYSRYLWVIDMKSTSTKATNRALLSICDNWGKPRMWQSDNGPQFISKEFREFWAREGVNTRTTIPYASHTNGLVEKQNTAILHAIRTALVEKQPWRLALSRYVKAYNTRPHCTTLFSPFHLLQGRKYHDYLPVFDSWDGNYERPPSRETVKANHDKAKHVQKTHYDKRNRVNISNIKEGDWVVLKNTNRTNKMESKLLVPRFRVMRIHKAMAIVRASDGRDFIRWIGHLKHDSGQASTVSNEPIDPEVLSDLLNSKLNISHETDEHPVSADLPLQEKNVDSQRSRTLEEELTDDKDPRNEPSTVNVSRTINLRDRKLINIPARYQNCVFNVYE